jgi:putative membrane protein
LLFRRFAVQRTGIVEIAMRITSLIAASVLVLSGPALAQSMGEKSGVNSVFGVAPHTSDFVTEAAQSDMFEIQSSTLAASRTTGDVQAFAKQMVIDHTKTTNDLKGLVQKTRASLPTAMSSSQQGMLDKLNGLTGDDFAKQYISDQVSAHKTAVSLFQRYANGGHNPQLKTWAAQTLPTLQHHLDMANSLNKLVLR